MYRCIDACMHVCMHACIYVCLCIHTYVSMYVFAYIHMYMYIFFKGQNYMFVFMPHTNMPYTNERRPVPVVKFSAILDFESTHAKQEFCTALSKANSKQDEISITIILLVSHMCIYIYTIVYIYISLSKEFYGILSYGYPVSKKYHLESIVDQVHSIKSHTLVMISQIPPVYPNNLISIYGIVFPYIYIWDHIPYNYI